MNHPYIDLYSEAQPVSIHPADFDVVASADGGYGGKFTAGFATKLVRLEQLAAVVCRSVWSPIVFLDGYRSSEGFVESAYMALDFDTPEYTLEAALTDWADSVGLIGVTRNHQKAKKDKPACDRFRVVVPWAEPITDLWTYTYNMTKLIDRYGADESCKDGGRQFYPCVKIVSVSKQGYAQPVLTAPPPRATPPPKVYRELGMVRRRTLVALNQPFPDNDKNNKCFECAKDLHDAGYGFDDIFRIIVESPTYGGRVDSQLGREIGQAIRSGIKSVNLGKAYGGRQRDGHQGGQGQEAKQEGAEKIGAILPDHPENEPPPAGP